MARLPWSKFFWSDWESDQGLRLSSLAAQGLWMRMLCVCARHEPRGYLAINGNPLQIEAIARLSSITPDEAETLLAELELNGVFSRDRSGCIYSRRMVSDEKASQQGRRYKKAALRQTAEKAAEKRKKPESAVTEKTVPDPSRAPSSPPSRGAAREPPREPPGNEAREPLTDPPREPASAPSSEPARGTSPQKPEARSQKEKNPLLTEGVKKSLPGNGETATAEPPLTAPPPEIGLAVEAYNRTAESAGWPKVQALSKARQAALGARLRDAGGMAGWEAALARARASDLCCGRNSRGWTVNFDFLTRESAFTKLMEGNYDNRTPGRSGSDGRPDGVSARPGYALRMESGWGEAMRALATAAGARSPIFDGSLGVIADAVLHKYDRVIRFNNYGTGAPGTVKAARALLMGRQAGVIAYGTPNGMRIQWQEEMRDYGNEPTIAAGIIFGFKKTRFNGRDFGVISIDTAADATLPAPVGP